MERQIKIRTGQDFAFMQVPDGAVVEIDGRQHTLRYLDETHFSDNGVCYHRDQFAEILVRRGLTVRLVEPQ